MVFIKAPILYYPYSIPYSDPYIDPFIGTLYYTLNQSSPDLSFRAEGGQGWSKVAVSCLWEAVPTIAVWGLGFKV